MICDKLKLFNNLKNNKTNHNPFCFHIKSDKIIVINYKFQLQSKQMYDFSMSLLVKLKQNLFE